ncbi:MAG: hypothetical protein AAF614_23760 [Chloroflexota bacterium]
MTTYETVYSPSSGVINPLHKTISATKEALSHVLWLGGATDSGKSTTAQKFAERHQFDVYHFDHSSARHFEKLTVKHERARAFIDASLDERWLDPTIPELLDFLFYLFPLRFELMLTDILAKPKDRGIVVEGFGLLPYLVQPYLSHPNQAIWFVPTWQFKRESMDRRNKPSFGSKTRDPQLARTNLMERDMMLADYFRKKVASLGYTLHETDGTLSIEQTIDKVDAHFQLYLEQRS